MVSISKNHPIVQNMYNQYTIKTVLIPNRFKIYGVKGGTAKDPSDDVLFYNSIRLNWFKSKGQSTNNIGFKPEIKKGDVVE